jgi:hypothetical protein
VAPSVEASDTPLGPRDSRPTPRVCYSVRRAYRGGTCTRWRGTAKGRRSAVCLVTTRHAASVGHAVDLVDPIHPLASRIARLAPQQRALPASATACLDDLTPRPYGSSSTAQSEFNRSAVRLRGAKLLVVDYRLASSPQHAAHRTHKGLTYPTAKAGSKYAVSIVSFYHLRICLVAIWRTTPAPASTTTCHTTSDHARNLYDGPYSSTGHECC